MIVMEGGTLSGRRSRVLLVDDEPAQLKLSRIRLEEAGYAVDTATNGDEAVQKMRRDLPDAIVSDVCMGELDGFALCRMLREDAHLAGVPVILLSAHCDGPDDEALSTRVGAARLVVRTPSFEAELDALATTLEGRSRVSSPGAAPDLYEQMLRRNANQITKLIVQVRSAEERYRSLFEHASDAITFLTPEGMILEANQRWSTILGVEPAEMVGRHIREFASPGAEDENMKAFLEAVAIGQGRSFTVPLRHVDGRQVLLELSIATTDIAGQPTILSIGRDVTEAILARQALAAAEARYRTLVERIPDVIWAGTPDGTISFATPNMARVLGYAAEEVSAQSLAERAARIHPDDRDVIMAAFQRCAKDGAPFDLEYRVVNKDGNYVWVRNRSTTTYEVDGKRCIEGMLSDINERKLLEESLQQAQKMEAMGQLTGGIAHDFNNILAAILANSHFLIEGLGEQDPRRADAEEIRIAAERAAQLTRQLLAFSRRQVLEPAVVDLNVAVSSVQKMLCRLIGEDVSLTVVPGHGLGAVRVDVGQLEQVIVNLAVNARDAMPAGGSLTIGASNIDVTAKNVSEHLPAEPGRYVVLRVEDTGSGMDTETKRRLFEPFFTTKEVGKGTGLGLATCYGIVKQSGGCIRIRTAPGEGSTFSIYLPRVEETVALTPTLPTVTRVEGAETVLVVEDDQKVRTAVKRMLENRGYRVLVASDATAATSLADAHPGDIHAVLTDVVMPGTSGPDLAHRVQSKFGSKVLFMSGYTDHEVLRSGVMEPGLSFIQKPFSPDALARKLREVLDG
jgi:two-component system, cell cycle sensor histidine kinase and response regulator CckA